ncbi:MAG: class I SAM-dependent methyltransferase [Gammaproteobacteria bacterium]|nr:class I SAM-dependent methyltransferase [Gammaproteobacteria bacterium]
MIVAELAFYIEDKTRESEGEQLAKKLQLPLVLDLQPNQLVLTLTAQRLELRLTNQKINPLYVDFLNQNIQKRLLKNKGRNELIAKAIGLKGHFIPRIIDATAGLGNDALVMANLGCEVTLLERSPIIFALLEDGLKRAQTHLPNWINNINLLCVDSIDFLNNELKHQRQVDVIYLDPMFPERTKSALVKKEMRILKSIVGEDEDAQALFRIAQRCAKKRVVVKRPRYAETLINESPSLIYKGKATRYDVYLSDTRKTQETNS